MKGNLQVMKMSFLKYLLLVGVVCCFGACATRSGKVVTMDSYLQVENGETREQILQQFGEPVSIEMNDEGVEIFTYIERFSMNNQVVEARSYYFYIKDGVVVGKIANVVDRPQVLDSDNL